MDMSAEKSGGSLSVAAVGGSADSDVVIDSAAIMSFFQEAQGAAPVSPRKHGAHKRRLRAAAELNAARRRRPGPSRRCACGSCYTCRENARWERIFQEKFADPSYYDQRSISFRSPLHVA